MKRKKEEYKIGKREIELVNSYPSFIGNALLEFYKQDPDADSHIENFSKWVNDIKEITNAIINIKIEAPIFRTCKLYYDIGSKEGKINSFIQFILAGLFGTGLGMCFGFLWPLGLFFTVVGVVVFLCLVFRKKTVILQND